MLYPKLLNQANEERLAKECREMLGAAASPWEIVGQLCQERIEEPGDDMFALCRELCSDRCLLDPFLTPHSVTPCFYGHSHSHAHAWY